MWDQRKYDEEWAVKDALTRKDAALIERLVRERDEWKRRAEAAEERVQKLTAMLNGQERLAQENAKAFDKVQAAAEHGVMMAGSLYYQWQEAEERAKAAELSLKLIEADNRDLIDAHRRIGELERALADEREGHAIDNDEGAEIVIDLKRQVEKLKATAPEGVFSPEDFSIINLMGDVENLTKLLSDAIERAWAARWQGAGFCPHCHADELRSSTDEYDDEQHLTVTVYRCGNCGAMWVGDTGEWIGLAKQLDAMTKRAEAAEAHVRELKSRFGSILPVAQPLITSIEFLPPAMANPLAEATKKAEEAEAKLAMVDNYGADQWSNAIQCEHGLGSQMDYQTFEKWLRSRV